MNEHDAYQLADILEKHYKLSTWSIFEQCADKLRKLQRENELLHKQQVDMTALRKHITELQEDIESSYRLIEEQDKKLVEIEKQRESLLEALEEFGTHYESCPQYPTYANPECHPPCNCGLDAAIKLAEENKL